MSPEGALLPPGELGEIVTRGDLVMNGYLDMPEETARTIVQGWLHTGDVGYLDERGYLYIKDRLRDVIITGGFNVYPSDVEAALARIAPSTSASCSPRPTRNGASGSRQPCCSIPAPRPRPRS